MSLTRAVPWLLLALLFAVELLASRGHRPEGTKRDRGSFWLVQFAFTAGFTAAFVMGERQKPWALPISPYATWLGVALAVLGGALRAWSIITLGRYFTRTVVVSSDQKVVDTGPYRLVRHPSYAGLGLIGLGVGVALNNWLSVAAIALAMLIGGSWRIRVEEEALATTIGEPYRAYMKRTKRLIPFIW